MGFSNGCAELTLKKPPPLLPSCLIAIQARQRAAGDELLDSLDRVTARKPWKFAMTPWLPSTTANRREIGSRMRVVPRTMSTQKLPMKGVRVRVRPADERDHDREPHCRGSEVLHEQARRST